MHVLATQLKMLYVSETKQNGNEIKINTKLEQNTCSHKNGNYSIVKKVKQKLKYIQQWKSHALFH